MNSRKILLLLCAALFLAFASGCATAGRKVKSVFYGSRGTVHVLALKDKSAAGYPYVIVEKFTTELGGADETLGTMRTNLVQLINDNKDPKKEAFVGATGAGSPALRIEGELLDFSEGDKFKRAATIPGGEAYIIMRYTVKDARTGETLAVFNSGGFIAGNIAISGKMDDVIPVLNWNVIRYLKGELH